jgi:hypothetical protein
VNRPHARSSVDGSILLRAGRFYRLLLVVNEAPLVEELQRAMAHVGFDGHDLALSASDDQWPDERPADWPAETLPDVAANEQLVRVSGSFSGRTLRVLVDTPIAGGGTFTIWQAWDAGPGRPADEETTGAIATGAPPAGAKSPTGVFVCLALGALGVGAWRFIANARRLEREEERLQALEARAERGRLGARIRELMTGGYPEGDATAIAAAESMARADHAALLEREPAPGAPSAGT